ncbi:MAG: hypothetical protein HYZ26_03565 [Chloroflexi bacterium]|nr:hypothetical protein [Chloroflexota bacterium]
MNRLRHITLLGLAGLLAACAPAAPAPTLAAAPSPTQTVAFNPLSLSSTPTPAAEPPLTPTSPACRAEGGQVLADFIPSDLLPQPLEFRLYLPPCYDMETGRRYPVLYLVHGQSYNQDQWDRLGADETADRLAASGGLPPFIIVMPRDRVWTQPSEDNFGQALVQELIPYIDETYRTCPERACRAIGGLSRGAAWALHLGLSEWEAFGALGLHSLPVFWDDVPHLRRWLEAIPPEDLPRIYLDVGERDRDEIKESTFWFRDLLDELGIPHEYTLFSGYHDEEYWASHMEQYLRFYAAGWQE